MKLLIIEALIVIASLLGCVSKAEDSVVFQGASMLPTIHDGEKIPVKKFEPGSKVEVQRGDIIVFLYPKDTSKFYIKRIVGLPGDKIEIREGEVFVNGNKLDEPYLDSKFNQSRASQQPLSIEEYSYYVLGDNRDASSDSRYWGVVPEKNILAKAVSR